MRSAKRQPGDSTRDVVAGDRIVREGDEGVEMFVIQSGRVEISRGEAPDRVVVARLGPTDFFGEMSVLESLPRDADATAITDVRLLVITQGGLLLRLRRDPTFAIEMLHSLSQRLRKQTADAAASPEDAS
jgi:CRP/FNR family cyclic AMP-dependent transcriptional regulator